MINGNIYINTPDGHELTLPYFGEMSFECSTLHDDYRHGIGTFMPRGVRHVLYNPPATIVIWSDGSKTVVKCSEADEFDREKGFLMCLAKKAFGRGYYRRIKGWCE